jgi:hypothetical protein
MVEGRNHRYEPIQMPALPSKAGELPLRGRVSSLPRGAQAQPTRRITRQTRGAEAKIVGRAGVCENHALRGELKGIGRNARLPYRRKLPSSMKIARILDEPGGTFRLEYDDTLGQKKSTRLDAMSYEQALREARSYLEIGEGDCDAEGAQWDIE